jgi:hypothetical protein
MSQLEDCAASWYLDRKKEKNPIRAWYAPMRLVARQALGWWYWLALPCVLSCQDLVMDEVNRRSNLGPSPTSIVKAFGLDFKVGIKSRPVKCCFLFYEKKKKQCRWTLLCSYWFQIMLLIFFMKWCNGIFHSRLTIFIKFWLRNNSLFYMNMYGINA